MRSGGRGGGAYSACGASVSPNREINARRVPSRGPATWVQFSPHRNPAIAASNSSTSLSSRTASDVCVLWAKYMRSPGSSMAPEPRSDFVCAGNLTPRSLSRWPRSSMVKNDAPDGPITVSCCTPAGLKVAVKAHKSSSFPRSPFQIIALEHHRHIRQLMLVPRNFAGAGLAQF